MLDEATSALDSFTRAENSAALRQGFERPHHPGDAHRLSTVVDADEIIVLDGGKIAERGTHDRLLRKKGIYAAMWNRQREADQARRILTKAETDKLDNPGELQPGRPLPLEETFTP